jgi:hypothetical protein
MVNAVLPGSLPRAIGDPVGWRKNRKRRTSRGWLLDETLADSNQGRGGIERQQANQSDHCAGKPQG